MKLKESKKVRVQLLDEKAKSKTFTVYDTSIKDLEKHIKESLKSK